MRVLAVILVFVAAAFTALLVMNSDEKVLRTVPASSSAAVDGVTLAQPVTVVASESVQTEESSGKDIEAGDLIPRAVPLFETAESKLPPLRANPGAKPQKIKEFPRAHRLDGQSSN